MRWQVLGPFAVLPADGEPALPLGGPKQRTLLAVLVAARGTVVPVRTLIEQLWGDDPPPKALASIQSYVANLRRLLDPDRSTRAADELLTTRPPGYVLNLDLDDLDAARFEKLLQSAAEISDPDPAAAEALLASAEKCWQGAAFADLDAPDLITEATRLDELRVLATEQRWRCRLALGQHERLVPEIEAAVAQRPLREGAWSLLALALYRSGRQGDAIAALARARRVLAEELGIDPGPDLQRMEADIFGQRPELQAPAIASSPQRMSLPVTPPPRLVGRDAELTRINQFLVNAAAGRGGLIVISGEPGIGKTGLAAAVSATAGTMGLWVGWGRSDEDAGTPSRWPWQQALGTLLPTVDETGEVSTAGFQLARAVEQVVRQQTGPAVIVLDDAHWADDASLQLLRALLPTLSALPLLILLTIRDADADVGPALAAVLSEVARGAGLRLRLGGLDAEAAAELMDSGHPLHRDVVAALNARAGGNPFLLTELIAMLGGEQQPLDARAAHELQVPISVRDVVRRRVDQLLPGTADYLAAAAVAGDPFDPELIEAICGLDRAAAVQAGEAALLAGLLVEQGELVRFNHALIRDAMLSRVPAGRRRELHAAIAGLLRRRPASEAELARHLAAAGMQHAAEARRVALSAAAHADRTTAVELLLVARNVLGRDPTATSEVRYEVMVALAIAQQRAGREREAWQTAGLAAAEALRDGRVVDAAIAATAISGTAIWGWREYLFVDTTAVELLEQLLTELPTDHPVLRSRLLGALAAELYYLPGAAARGDALSRSAVELARSAGDPADLMRALVLRHVAIERPQLLTERLQVSKELLSLAERAHDEAAVSQALIFRGRDLMESGDLAAGMADYERARAIADRLGLAPVLVVLGWFDATLLIARGDFDGGSAAIERATALHASTSLAGLAPIPLLMEAVLHLTRGTLPAFEHVLTESWRATGLPLLRDLTMLARVRAGDVVGWPADVGGRDVAVPDDYMWPTHQWVRAMVCAGAAAPAAAAELAGQLAPFAGRMVFGGTGISLLGSFDLILGMLWGTAGERDRAIEHLSVELQLATNHGFAPFAATARQELAKLGVAV